MHLDLHLDQSAHCGAGFQIAESASEINGKMDVGSGGTAPGKSEAAEVEVKEESGAEGGGDRAWG